MTLREFLGASESPYRDPTPQVDPAAMPEPCNHPIGFCTGYCEHADIWRAYMDHKNS